MSISGSQIAHHLVALIKYVVVVVLLVVAAKLLPGWLGGTVCFLDSDDDSMRDALGRSTMKVSFDPAAWNEDSLALGDIVIVNQEVRVSGETTRRNFPFRVIAVAGDVVEANMGKFKINGQDENYEGVTLKAAEHTRADPKAVPRGYVYVLPDDRRAPKGGHPELIPAWRLVGKVVR
jgi:hypothetical protein